MGSSKSVKVGYRYYFGIHMLLGRGEVDELLEIKVGGKRAWRGSATGNTSFQINAGELFGGDDGEGGIQGRLDVMMGAPTQPVNANLAAMLGGIVPAFRGMFTLFYDGLVTSMNPYPKPWTFRVRRALKGWDGDVWYSDKAVITMIDPETGDTIKAMNPAHILYELETNRDWGRGKSRTRIDDAAWRAAADQLYAEGFGLCIRWVRSDSIDSFAGGILDHIAGNLYTSRTTGLRKLTLVRDNYDVDDLPHFTPEDGLLDIEDDDNSANADAANEVVVTWRNPVDNSKRPARERNLAAIRAAGGRVISVTTEYLGIPTYALAARVAKRDLRAKVAAKRWKLVLDRRARDIEPGAAFRFSSPARGLYNIVVRAGRVDEGTLDQGKMTITAVLDVFGMPSTTFSAPPPSGWTPPNTTPQAVTVRRLVEATWRDLAASIDAANMQLLDATSTYLAALAVRPTSLSQGFHLHTRVGSAAFGKRDGGDFCPTALLATAIPIGHAPVVVGVTAPIDLDQVVVGTAVLIDDEILRVDAIDQTALIVTLARGCADTIPAQHATGVRMWFYEGFAGNDPTEYSSGVTVDAKLLTSTSSGILSADSAPTDSLLLQGRAGRPYAPGAFRIQGEILPTALAGVLELTYAHRDRTLQADQLVDTAQGSIGPEPGVNYKGRLTRVDTGEALDAQSSSSASMSLFGAYDGLVEVELWAERGGLASWQVYKRRFNYTFTFTGWATPAAVITAMSEAYADFNTLPATAVRTNYGLSLSQSYMGGVLGPDGRIYAVPANAASILIINPASGTASLSAMGASLSGSSKFNGGLLGPNGKIYCIPSAATDILIIDPLMSSATRSTMGLSLTSTSNKWFGGSVGLDGKLYCVPFESTQILIIDPSAGTASLNAMGATLTGAAKWIGAVLANNGKIYCIPHDATDILIIDTTTGTATRSTMGASLSGSSKWCGGVLGSDGKIYGIPYNATDILIIDPVAGTATRSAMGATLSGSNKWECGAFAPNGKIYGLPRNASDILVIDPVAGTATRSTLGASLSGSDKWYGGVLGRDGKIYTVPGSTGSGDVLVISVPDADALPADICWSPKLNKF